MKELETTDTARHQTLVRQSGQVEAELTALGTALETSEHSRVVLESSARRNASDAERNENVLESLLEDQKREVVDALGQSTLPSARYVQLCQRLESIERELRSTDIAQRECRNLLTDLQDQLRAAKTRELTLINQVALKRNEVRLVRETIAAERKNYIQRLSELWKVGESLSAEGNLKAKKASGGLA